MSSDKHKPSKDPVTSVKTPEPPQDMDPSKKPQVKKSEPKKK